MREDFDCPECFECNDECSAVDGILVCDGCGKRYTQKEWDEANEKQMQSFVQYWEENLNVEN